MAQRARAVRRLFLRPQPAPSPPGAAGSLAPSCPRQNVPGWAWVRLLTRPARPAPTTRPDPEAEGAVPAVAGAWPRPAPSRVAGLRGVGRGRGCCNGSPHPFPSCAPPPLARGAHTPCGLLARRRPLLGHPGPGVPAAPFCQDPLTPCRLAFSFTSHCPYGQRSLSGVWSRETPGGIWTCQGRRGRFCPKGFLGV